MNSSNALRIALVGFGLLLGSYALASTVAELGSLDRPQFPSDPANIGAASADARRSWLQTVAPFRSDIEGNDALIAALQTLRSGRDNSDSGQSTQNAEAQNRVKQTLSVAPYNAELWLALALLRAQRNPRDPLLTATLKMAYFTAPSDARLMAVRLDAVTRFDAVADPELKELARGDVRLMLMRQGELKPAVLSAYRRASNLGQAFLEESVQSIDPSFLPKLHGQEGPSAKN